MPKRRANGEGTVRLRGDGRWEGRYIVGYRDNGTAITKNVLAKSKDECIDKLNVLKETCVQISGKLPTQAKSSMTFGEWMDLWYQNYSKPGIRETTQEGYETRIYKHIIPSIGHIQLDKLTQNDLQQFYTWLKNSGRLRLAETKGSGLSDRTVRSCHASCRSALDKAVAEGLIHKNPAIGCKLPPKKGREMQVLERDELQRFLIQAKEEGYYEIFMLDLATGMRRGELLGLQWDDLNQETGELHIQRQVAKVKGKMTVSTPKTKASVRTVILPRSVVHMLSEYRRSVHSRWMFPSPIKKDLPRDPQNVYRRMQKVLEHANCKRVRFHDLRHTFATMALAHGMDVKTLSAMIGHISSATTLDIYSHVTNEMQVRSAEKIERSLGRNEPRPAHFGEFGQTPERTRKRPPEPKFEPYRGKIRKSGTGCVTMINDHLYEGRFTPTDADGKRISRNIYAQTREECEEKLAAMIVEMKAGTAEAKEKNSC